MSQRPTVITILSVLYYVLGAIFELLGLLGLITAFAAGAGADLTPAFGAILGKAVVTSLGAVGAGILTAAIFVPTGLIWLILGWGLWDVKPWSRSAAIIVAAITAIVTTGLLIWGIFIPSPTLIFLGFIWLVLSVLVIYYLLQPSTRDAFEGAYPQPAPYRRVPPQPQRPERTPYGRDRERERDREDEYRDREAGSTQRQAPMGNTTPLGGTQRIQQESTEFANLIVKAGSRRGTIHKLNGVTNIGRSANNDISIPDDQAVSGTHARIRKDDGQYWLTDLDSTNGTEVNGQRVTKQALADHDSIKVGNTVFEFLWTK